MLAVLQRWGTWGMGYCWQKSLAGAPTMSYSPLRHSSDLLASPVKFSSSQYNFPRILLDHNLWVNLERKISSRDTTDISRLFPLHPLILAHPFPSAPGFS